MEAKNDPPDDPAARFEDLIMRPTCAALANPSKPPSAVLEADAADPLAAFRGRFRLPEGVIYLDGNSLGALPATTPKRLVEAIEQEWGRDLIASWNRHDWIGAPRRVGDKIARLIGAQAGEVIVADSTSVNLFKLLGAALDRQRGRGTLLSEPGNFPTDLYVAEGVIQMMGGVRLLTRPADEIAAAIDDDTAVVMLTHVHYKSGRKLDMAAITAAAHAKGALVLWDLSHSVGALPVDLNGCGADLAVGCGYKYLNGGPGAPAFLFVADRLQAELRSPLSGWMGHARPFDFVDAYAPGDGIDRFACGTPPILSLIALEQGVDLMLEADPELIAAKARALSELFFTTVEGKSAGLGLTLVSPRNPADRGSHVAFAHDQAYAICQALIDRGVVGDFRAPDLVRFGFTPLYTRFTDVWTAAERLIEVVASGAYRRGAYQARARVT
jgi:kynureninase